MNYQLLDLLLRKGLMPFEVSKYCVIRDLFLLPCEPTSTAWKQSSSSMST